MYHILVETHLDKLHVTGQRVVHHAGEQCHLRQQEDVSEVLLDGGTFVLKATDLLQWSMLGAPIYISHFLVLHN